MGLMVIWKVLGRLVLHPDEEGSWAREGRERERRVRRVGVCIFAGGNEWTLEVKSEVVEWNGERERRAGGHIGTG